MGKGTAILAGLLAAPLIAGGVIAAVPKFRTTALDWIAKHSDIYKTAVANNDKLEKDNEDLQSENETLTTDKTALQAQVATLTGEKHTMENELGRYTQNIRELNSRIDELVAQAEENNQEFKFGRYAYVSEPRDTNIYPHGMRDITFIDIYEDNTGKELFINENGELEEGEEFTYVEDNGNVSVTYAVGTEDEYTTTFAIRDGKIVLGDDNSEDVMEYVYCNDNLFEALIQCDLTQYDYRQLRIQLVNKDNQIDQLNARIAELEAQQGENRAEYTVTRRQNITIGVGGSGLNAVIQSKTGNSILTQESTFSGQLNGSGLFGTWDSASSGGIEIIDNDIYTFSVNENEFGIEITVNSDYYPTSENVSPETHIYVNGTEVTSEEEFSTMSSSYVTMFHQVDYELNENNELTSLVISTYITGEIEQGNMDDPSEPEEETQYTIQTNVTYQDETGVNSFTFADNGTFESVQGAVIVNGRYEVMDTNYYTLYVEDTEYWQFQPTSADSFELNGTTYTVQTVAPGGEN